MFVRVLKALFIVGGMAVAGCSSSVAPSPELDGGVVATFESAGEQFRVFVKHAAAIDRLVQIRNGAR